MNMNQKLPTPRTFVILDKMDIKMLQKFYQWAAIQNED